MSTWFAIRTAPGAQMPQREFVVEDSPKSRKGYRIVPSLNPNVSAVERALTDAGFHHYMPVERRLVRDKKKLGLWKPRRFPLLLGYAFVEDVTDFRKLEDTPGVSDIVKVHGVPYRMPINDIATLRQIEAECEERAERQRRILEEKASRLTRRKSAAMFPSGSRVLVNLRGDHKMGTVSGLGRDGRLRAIVDGLREISVPVEALELVA